MQSSCLEPAAERPPGNASQNFDSHTCPSGCNGEGTIVCFDGDLHPLMQTMAMQSLLEQSVAHSFRDVQ